MFDVCDAVYSGGKIDQDRLRPVVRIGRPIYVKLGEFIKIKAPAPVG